MCHPVKCAIYETCEILSRVVASYSLCTLRIVPHLPIRANNCQTDLPGSNSAHLDCIHIRNFSNFKLPIQASRFEINWSAGKTRSPRASVNKEFVMLGGEDFVPKPYRLFGVNVHTCGTDSPRQHSLYSIYNLLELRWHRGYNCKLLFAHSWVAVSLGTRTFQLGAKCAHRSAGVTCHFSLHVELPFRAKWNGFTPVTSN